MIVLRFVAFIFFAIALYGSVDCLLDSERVLEHNGAWIGMYTCVVACVFLAIKPNSFI